MSARNLLVRTRVDGNLNKLGAANAQGQTQDQPTRKARQRAAVQPSSEAHEPAERLPPADARRDTPLTRRTGHLEDHPMACYSPINAYRRHDGSVGFHDAPADRENLELPCGRCIGCRLDRGRDWAVRCMHEAKLFANNTTLHLTYKDEKLPIYGTHRRGPSPVPTLRYSDIQKFLKRLRKEFMGHEPGPSRSYPIRYFVAGEYGETTLRPHYHMLLFNFDFFDKQRWGQNYTSETLNDIWGLGNTQLSEATPERVAYVTRYALKKVYGRAAENHYQHIDPATGEVFQRAPEMAHMSRRPGIGKWWMDRFPTDFMGRDHIIVDGHKMKTPKYYERKIAEQDDLETEEAKRQRWLFAQNIPATERSPERRATREEVALRTLAHKGQANRGF